MVIITKKLFEFYHLENKIHRYQTRLMIEGLLIAKEVGFERLVVKDGSVDIVGADTGKDDVLCIKAEYLDDDNGDVGPIIDLAECTLPSLYRRFYVMWDKWCILYKEIDEYFRRKKARTVC